MEAPTSLAYLVDFLIDYSQYSTQLRDWSVMVESTTTSRLCSLTYIGFEFRSISSFVWPFSSTVVETTQHPSTRRETCSGQQTATPGDDYGLNVNAQADGSTNQTEDGR